MNASTRVVLLALGSRGDVQPLAVLGAALQRHGYNAVLVSSDDFEPLAVAQGVPFVSLGAGQTYSRSEVATDARWRRRYERSALGAALALKRVVPAIAEPLAKTLDGLVKSGDVLISGILGVPAILAARETLGCRAAFITLSATVPTADGDANCSAPLPGRISRLNSWWTAQAGVTLTQWTAAPGDVLRRRHGCPVLPARVLYREASMLPCLVAASPLLAPVASDWPDNAVSTGPLIPPGGPSYVPDAALSDFLSSGPAPVYLGLGSALAGDPARDVRTFRQATNLAGVRAVIRPSEYGYQADADVDPDPRVHVVASVPHEWLFPRMAAIVHHGGVGTTTAALRAGVPSSVIWHAFDQPYHGRKCASLGVGPMGFAKSALTVERLANLLRGLTASAEAQGYRLQAECIAAQMRAEAGAEAAVAQLQRWGLLTADAC